MSLFGTDGANLDNVGEGNATSIGGFPINLQDTIPSGYIIKFNATTNTWEYGPDSGTSADAAYIQGVPIIPPPALPTANQILRYNNITARWEYSSVAFGDVIGPASSDDSAVALFNGTTGKIIENSGIIATGASLTGLRLGDGTDSNDETLLHFDKGDTQWYIKHEHDISAFVPWEGLIFEVNDASVDNFTVFRFQSNKSIGLETTVPVGIGSQRNMYSTNFPNDFSQQHATLSEAFTANSAYSLRTYDYNGVDQVSSEIIAATLGARNKVTTGSLFSEAQTINIGTSQPASSTITIGEASDTTFNVLADVMNIGNGLTNQITFIADDIYLGDNTANIHSKGIDIETIRPFLINGVAPKGSIIAGNASTYTPLAVGTNGYVLKANSATATGLEWAPDGTGGDVTGAASSVNNSVVLFDGVTGKLIKDSAGTAAFTVGDSSSVITMSGVNKSLIATASTRGELHAGTTTNANRRTKLTRDVNYASLSVVTTDNSNYDIFGIGVNDTLNTIGTVNAYFGLDISTAANPFKVNAAAPKGSILAGNNTTYSGLPIGTDGYVLSANSATGTGLQWVPAAPAPGTASYSECSTFINSLATTFTAAGAYTPILCTTTTTGLKSADFTITNGTTRMTYTGATTKTFRVSFVGTAYTAGGIKDMGLRVYKNTSAQTKSESAWEIDATTTDRDGNAVQCLVSLATNDYIEINATNLSDTTNIIFRNFNVTATEVTATVGAGAAAANSHYLSTYFVSTGAAFTIGFVGGPLPTNLPMTLNYTDGWSIVGNDQLTYNGTSPGLFKISYRICVNPATTAILKSSIIANGATHQFGSYACATIANGTLGSLVGNCFVSAASGSYFQLSLESAAVVQIAGTCYDISISITQVPNGAAYPMAPTPLAATSELDEVTKLLVKRIDKLEETLATKADRETKLQQSNNALRKKLESMRKQKIIK